MSSTPIAFFGPRRWEDAQYRVVTPDLELDATLNRSRCPISGQLHYERSRATLTLGGEQVGTVSVSNHGYSEGWRTTADTDVPTSARKALGEVVEEAASRLYPPGPSGSWDHRFGHLRTVLNAVRRALGGEYDRVTQSLKPVEITREIEKIA